MPDPLTVQLNGQPRAFAGLTAPSPLSHLIESLGLKPDRIAVEHNGEIAPRPTWPSLQIHNNDRLEIVHFVGGGAFGFTEPAGTTLHYAAEALLSAETSRRSPSLPSKRSMPSS